MSSHSIRWPSLDGLRALEALERLGTIERAAESLHIGASAVSKRLNALEELLGTPLLDRSAKPVRLTPAGQVYLQQVRPALDLLRAVPLHQPTLGRPRRLRVMTPPTFAREILVPRLEDFTRLHSEIEMEIILSLPQARTPDPGSCDVEIRFGASTQTPPLIADRVVPMASPGLLRQFGTLRDAQDLMARNCCLKTPLEPWGPWLRQAGLPEQEPLEGPSFLDLGLLMEAAVAGLGVALGRPVLAHHWLERGALVPVSGISAAPAFFYHASVHSDHPLAEPFHTWLRAHCMSLTQIAHKSLLEKFSPGP